MVTVDDATYVKMRDTLYGGDAGKASRAKAQIEANYDDAKYNDFLGQLNNMGSQTSTSSSKNSGPADGYATATDRNMATGGSEFGRNNQTSNTSSNTPATPTTNNSNKGGETVVTSNNEIKQEGALKPLSQDYYNQTSQDAQDQIVKNLNDYKQSNPEYFTDYESFKRNFSYDARDDVQKNTLDQWYKGYQDGLTLSSTPTTDLYTQYKNGDLSDAQLQSLRVSDPTKYSELMSQINTGNIVAAYDDDKGMDITGNSIQEMAYQAAQQMFMQWMKGDTDNGASQFFREYEEKMESPEMKGLSDQCTEVQEQIENLQDDIASMKEAVEREYAGTGASRAKINAIIADRTYDLQLQLRTANSEYNKYATQYNNRMQQYQNEFQLGLQEYQINQQARQQQMQELGFAMDLMSFETPQQKQDREWNYWVKQQEYQNGNINSKDYQTRYKAALNSVQNLLSQYEGIPMSKSAEQMADEILKAIDGGSNLGAELTKINKQIQQQPEYKKLYNETFGNSGGIGKTRKVGDKEYIEYNGELYTADEFNKLFGGANGVAKAYNTVDPSLMENKVIPGVTNNLGKFLIQKANGMNGGQCGRYVNDYLQYIGVTGAGNRYYDDSIATKLNSVNTYDPTVGAVAVFDYNHKSSDGINHGHVAIVTNVDYQTGTITIKESNKKGDEKVGTRKINMNDPALRGFFDPSQPPLNSGADATSGNSDFISGSIEGVPLVYERSVKNLVPAALQNSDGEREALNTTITNAYKGGIDQSEIALTYMGFGIKNQQDKDLALDLVNTIRTLATETQEGTIQTISDLMNQGEYSKAIQTVENAVTKQAKEAGNYVSESSVKNTINRSNDLASYVNSLKDSPIGVVEGNMQEWLNTYASKDAKKIANLTALIETSLDIKDKETLNRIVPQLTDQPSVFMSKLENLNNSLMSELNGWRNIYGLPSLTTETLSNPSSRVSLYRSGGPQTTTDSFYEKYVNTAPRSKKVELSNGMTFEWNE